MRHFVLNLVEHEQIITLGPGQVLILHRYNNSSSVTRSTVLIPSKHLFMNGTSNEHISECFLEDFCACNMSLRGVST